MCVCLHVRACVRACVCVFMRACEHMRVCLCGRVYARAHACVLLNKVNIQSHSLGIVVIPSSNRSIFCCEGEDVSYNL